MKVLSIRQPWAWLIVKGLKDLENRDWSTRYRGPLLIHAGKQFDASLTTLDYILDRLEWEENQFPLQREFECGGIVGIVELVDVVTKSDSCWFNGGYTHSYAWLFEKARPLPFMPLRGQLGLFDAPSEIVARVRAEIEKARGVA